MKKILLSLAVMLASVGAWAQQLDAVTFTADAPTQTQNWTGNAQGYTPWSTTHLSDSEYPTELEPTANFTVTYATTEITIPTGGLEILFDYTGGNERLDILGIDLLTGEEVVASDYRKTFTGSNNTTTYYVAIENEGTYTLRYFVQDQPKNTTTTTSCKLKETNGTITLTYVSDKAMQELLTTAKAAIANTDVGYPVSNAESRTQLQTCIDNAEESVSSAYLSLRDALNAYYACDDITLPEDGKFYKLSNFAYDGGGTTRYIKYVKGSKTSLTKEEGEATTFVCKILPNNTFVFVCSDGSILTWVGNDDNTAYNESGVYGYSTYYALTFNGKNDWNQITLKKNGTAEKDFGYLRMVARRNAGATSAFIVKGKDNRFDQASDGYWFGESGDCFSSAWKILEVAEQTKTSEQELALAKIDAKNELLFSDKVLGTKIGEYHYTVDGVKVYTMPNFDEKNTIADVAELNTLAANLPEIGKYYIIKGTSGWYLTGKDAKISGRAALRSIDVCDQDFIFYYNEDRKLICYGTGKGLWHANSTHQAHFNKDASDAKEVSFVKTFANNEATGRGLFIQIDGHTIRDFNNKNDRDDIGCNNNYVSNGVWTIDEFVPTISVGSAKYSTFYAPVAVTIPTGVSAYYVSSVEGESAKMTLIEGDAIPANTAVILHSATEVTAAATIVPYSSGTAISDNKLKGTVVDTNITPEDGNTCYVLAKPDGMDAGFYKAELNQDSNTSFKNNAGKAYLEIGTPAASARLLFDFGTETAIESIEGAENADAVVYDLAGRRVKGAQKGLYIVNGKVVIK